MVLRICSQMQHLGLPLGRLIIYFVLFSSVVLTSGCAVVSATAGAAIAVTGAVASTAVSAVGTVVDVSGKAVGAMIDSDRESK